MPITVDKATQRQLGQLHDDYTAKGRAVADAEANLVDLRLKVERLGKRLAAEERAPVAKVQTPSLVDALTADPDAVLEGEGMDHAEAEQAAITRAERRRAATVRTIREAITKMESVIERAEIDVAEAERVQARAETALAEACYDVLLDEAALRMEALAGEVLIPLRAMERFRQRGGVDAELTLSMDRLFAKNTVPPHPLLAVRGDGAPFERRELYFLNERIGRDRAAGVDLFALFSGMAGRRT